MEQMKREIYNEMMHSYLAEELIKEVHERTKLLDEDYAESIKMQENHLQELKSCLNEEQTKKLEEYIGRGVDKSSTPMQRDLFAGDERLWRYLYKQIRRNRIWKF